MLDDRRRYKLREEVVRLGYRLNHLRAERDELREERDGLQDSLDLQHKCMDRAQKRWQEAHPDANYWPDGAKNIIWLLDELDHMTERVADLVDVDESLIKVMIEREVLRDKLILEKALATENLNNARATIFGLRAQVKFLIECIHKIKGAVHGTIPTT